MDLNIPEHFGSISFVAIIAFKISSLKVKTTKRNPAQLQILGNPFSSNKMKRSSTKGWE